MKIRYYMCIFLFFSIFVILLSAFQRIVIFFYLSLVGRILDLIQDFVISLVVPIAYGWVFEINYVLPGQLLVLVGDCDEPKVVLLNLLDFLVGIFWLLECDFLFQDIDELDPGEEYIPDLDLFEKRVHFTAFKILVLIGSFEHLSDLFLFDLHFLFGLVVFAHYKVENFLAGWGGDAVFKGKLDNLKQQFVEVDHPFLISENIDFHDNVVDVVVLILRWSQRIVEVA